MTLRELILGCAVDGRSITDLRHPARSSGCRWPHARAETLTQGLPPELAAIDLNDAREALEEIIGVVHNDDILERIFHSFLYWKIVVNNS